MLLQAYPLPLEKDECTDIVIKSNFRLSHFGLTCQNTVSAPTVLKLVGSPHFGSTHQGTCGTFVLKQTSSNEIPQIFLAVHLPHLVSSPNFGSTHQATGKAFAPKRISSDKPPHCLSAVHLPQLVSLPNFGSTHQGKDFVLKRISSDKPLYLFPVIHLPRLVGSPYFLNSSKYWK